NDVNVLETEFNQSLAEYQKNYEIATSTNMSTIRGILVSDTTDHGQAMIRKQSQALDIVSRGYWPNYQTLLHKVLQDLAANTNYLVAYGDFYQASLGFLELKNRWQVVVDTATEMGTTVTKVGPSLTVPLYTYTVIALLLSALVIVAAGFLISTTIVSPL